MNAVTRTVEGELADVGEFFAPASTDMVDGLVGQYKQDRARIERVAEFMATDVAGVLNYFVEGNKHERDRWYGVEGMFQPAGALKALNSDYWNRALRLTDVLDMMPQKRRDEWFEQIRAQTCPDFEEATVRATLEELLGMRGKFFAEKVDGLFRALSGTHVTNEPQGFGKRMIMANVLQSYGTVNHSKAGYINDLRAVIAKFMGRDEPGYGASTALINAARRNPGEWMSVDGGALRIRVYSGVGTAHLEVHPDMAWRLNGILASLYPAAIPPKFRQKPARQPKSFQMMARPLPFAVVETIAAMKEAWEFVETKNHWAKDRRYLQNTRAFEREPSKVVRDEVCRVMEAIGGVWASRGVRGDRYFQFDYDPAPVIDEIVCSGCIPDRRSHQFYPTPDKLARIAVDIASEGAEPGMRWLEPSAGIGGLADLMPADDTHCVEISPLHCAVLEAKGFSLTQADFLALAPAMKPIYDRIVMNPPFSEGRWQAHLQAAAKLLAVGGRLVAILPASAKGKDELLADAPGIEACSWSEIYSNEFAGTSVSVVILTVDALPF